MLEFDVDGSVEDLVDTIFLDEMSVIDFEVDRIPQLDTIDDMEVYTFGSFAGLMKRGYACSSGDGNGDGDGWGFFESHDYLTYVNGVGLRD